MKYGLDAKEAKYGLAPGQRYAAVIGRSRL
jgi:hypothetical protein